MTDEEWLAEEEINRLQVQAHEKDTEIQRLREIESAARWYRENEEYAWENEYGLNGDDLDRLDAAREKLDRLLESKP